MAACSHATIGFGMPESTVLHRKSCRITQLIAKLSWHARPRAHRVAQPTEYAASTGRCWPLCGRCTRVVPGAATAASRARRGCLVGTAVPSQVVPSHSPRVVLLPGTSFATSTGRLAGRNSLLLLGKCGAKGRDRTGDTAIFSSIVAAPPASTRFRLLRYSAENRARPGSVERGGSGRSPRFATVLLPRGGEYGARHLTSPAGGGSMPGRGVPARGRAGAMTARQSWGRRGAAAGRRW